MKVSEMFDAVMQQEKPTYGHTEEAHRQKIEQAKADGFEVVRSNARTLLLDLDTPHAAEQYLRVLPIVDEHFGVAEVSTWRSKSGRISNSASLPRCFARSISCLTSASAIGASGRRCTRG